MESIHKFFEWCETSSVHDAIQGHEAAYPALETFHLFGLTLLLGTIVILSLRLMGAILKKQPRDSGGIGPPPVVRHCSRSIRCRMAG